MHSVSANQIADIFTPYDNPKYHPGQILPLCRGAPQEKHQPGMFVRRGRGTICWARSGMAWLRLLDLHNIMGNLLNSSLLIVCIIELLGDPETFAIDLKGVLRELGRYFFFFVFFVIYYHLCVFNIVGWVLSFTFHELLDCAMLVRLKS